jgi:hypothetical protein
MKIAVLFLTITLFMFSLVYGGDESKLKMRVVKLDPEKTQQIKRSTFPDHPENSERKEDPNRIIKLKRNKTVIDDNGQSWRFGSESVALAKDDTITKGWYGGGEEDNRFNINSAYYIINNNDTLFSFSALSRAMSTNGIVRLFLQNGNYIIVYQKFERFEKVKHIKKWINSIHIVINGVDLNISRGYENSCAPGFINGQLFYLFQKKGKWGWFFDGVEHPDLWDEVFYRYGDGGWGPNSCQDPSYRRFRIRKDGKWCIMRGVLETEQ